MPAKNRTTTISLSVTREFDALIRAEHARRVEAYAHRYGHRRGGPSLSAVWEEMARRGYSQAPTSTLTADTETEAA